ncbi:hypothetical protein ACM25O_13355 [Sulfitobacter pontiacus]
MNRDQGDIGAPMTDEQRARANGWTPGAVRGWRRDALDHEWQSEPGESFYAETVADALAWDSSLPDAGDAREPGA